MKFFIFTLYTAHLLIGITAWLLTTPMQSALRSKTKNDATSQVMKVVNSAYFKDNGRNNGQSSRYGGLHYKHVSRRFELPALTIKKRPAYLVPKDDKDTQLEIMAESMRYHVTKNPEVLEVYSNKRKRKKNFKRYLMRKKRSSDIIDNQSLEAKYFHSDVKMISYQKNAALKAHNSSNILNTTDAVIQTSHCPTNPTYELDGDLELTNIESIYQPSILDDDRDNDIEFVGTTEKENSKPRTDDKNHALSAKIYKSNKFEKITDIKARGMKHKVSVPEDNAHKNDFNDTEPNKRKSLPFHDENDYKNDKLTKKEENKEFDYNRNVRMRADNLNPKPNDYSENTEGEKERKDILPQQKSKIENKRKRATTSRKYKNNRNEERDEGHFIYVQQDRNANSTGR